MTRYTVASTLREHPSARIYDGLSGKYLPQRYSTRREAERMAADLNGDWERSERARALREWRELVEAGK